MARKPKTPAPAVIHGIKGFDANPLAVFDYYYPAGARYFRVTLSGAMDQDGNKTAAEIIMVGDELGISGLVAGAVAWVQARATEKGEHVKGHRSVASAMGDQSAASAMGDQSAARGGELVEVTA